MSLEYDPLTLRRPIAELERWATKMVLWFKPERLPLPVITIQCGHPKALGWFAWSRWESRDGEILNEINFVPEYLGRDVLSIAETLVHELVHLANYTAGVRDCTSNQYHNAHFRDRAISVGLACERMDPHGWARTSLTPELHERIASMQPDPSAFDLFRLPPAPRKGIRGVVGGPLDVVGVNTVGTIAKRKSSLNGSAVGLVHRRGWHPAQNSMPFVCRVAASSRAS